MSGPKTSRYTLTPEQQRILEEQRKIRIETEVLQKKRERIRNEVISTDRLVTQATPLLMEIGKNVDCVEKVSSLRNKCMEQYNETAHMNQDNSYADLKSANDLLDQYITQLRKAVEILQDAFTREKQNFEAQTNEKIGAGFEVSFAGLFLEEKKPSIDYAKEISEVLTSLREMRISTEQALKIERVHSKAMDITDPEFLKSYYAMTVLPLVKECRQMHDEYNVYGSEFEHLNIEYCELSARLNAEVNDYTFSIAALHELRSTVSQLRNIVQAQEEQEYIAKCMDEAMVELGYKVVGTRDLVRRNGRKYHNELYLFEEGTAVNVTYSDDGCISMELGGIDHVDRIPETSEVNGLVTDMRAFCDDYLALEAILRKKGVVTKNISILPPDSQYAQIINVSDYEMRDSVELYEQKKSKNTSSAERVRRIGE